MFYGLNRLKSYFIRCFRGAKSRKRERENRSYVIVKVPGVYENCFEKRFYFAPIILFLNMKINVSLRGFDEL